MAHLSGRTLGALAQFFTHSFISSIPCQLDQDHEAGVRAVAHQWECLTLGTQGFACVLFCHPTGAQAGQGEGEEELFAILI